jgi:hypothetical protein
MTRHALLGVVLAVVLGGAHCTMLACTSFAVYSGKTLYGMNFDYPPCEVRFVLEEHKAGLVFIGSFWMEDHYGRTVGMNDQGLFASCQMVSPARASAEEPKPDELYIWNAFYEGVQSCSCVSGVAAFIADKLLVQYPSLGLHNLYADAEGSAMVVEPGETGNVITEMDGPFIVMTNFPNGDFQGVGYHEVRGDGAHRYETAYASIEEHFGDFDLDDAFEIVERTVQSTGEYPTLYSLVFDPLAREVYIAIERDFDHIWKVSLDDRSIESFYGFDEQISLSMGSEGILASALQGYVPTQARHGWWRPAMVITALLAIGLGLALLLMRQ